MGTIYFGIRCSNSPRNIEMQISANQCKSLYLLTYELMGVSSIGDRWLQ